MRKFKNVAKKLAVAALAAVTMFGANPFNAVASERIVGAESTQTYLREEVDPNHLVTSHPFHDLVQGLPFPVPSTITHSVLINGQLFTGTLTLLPGTAMGIASGTQIRGAGVFTGTLFSTNIFNHEDVK